MQPTNLIPSFAGTLRCLCIHLTFLISLLAGMSLSNLHAATRTWTGGHASSANWNLRDNWGGVAVPTHGDTVVFPSGAARLFNTNNIAGLRLHSIVFDGAGGGYILRGNSVSLSNGITVITDSVNTLRLDSLSMSGAQTINVAPGAVLTVYSDIALAGATLNLAAIGDLTLRGAITGTGDIRKTGAGQLSLSGAGDNTFTGSLTIASGTLAMNKFETTSLAPLTQESRIAVPGNLILGNGSGSVEATTHFDAQIADSGAVTIFEDASLNLNGHHDTVGDIVLKGGVINTGAGTLTLGGNVASLASPDNAVINGLLLLGGDCTFSVDDGPATIDLEVRANIDGGIAHITKAGSGIMRLGGTNSYKGTTSVNGGQLNAGNDSALGTANGTTVVAAGAQLLLEHGVDTLEEHLTLSGAGIGGTNAALRVAGSAAIQFTVTLGASTTIDVPFGSGLSLEGVVSGTGPLTKIGAGTLQLAGSSANTFTGGLMARNGLLLLSKLAGSAVQGDLIIGSTDTTATARHTRSANLGGVVTVNAGSLYDLDGNNESIDALTLNAGGDVRTGTGMLTLDGDVVVNPPLALSGTTSTIDGRLGVGVGSRQFIVAETGGIGGDGADLRINARISGTADIIKSGPGDLSLTASNSFTGQLTVQDGELLISNDYALGSTAANTVLTGDSILHVSGDLTVDENLFLNAAGKANVGVVRSQGTNDWTGSIFLGQTTVVNVATNSELNAAGLINGLGGLTKTGPGLLVYSGTASNTYFGSTIVNEGTLRLERTTAHGSIPGDLFVGNTVGAPQYDVVEATGPVPQISEGSDIFLNYWSRLVIELPGTQQRIATLSGFGSVELDGATLVLDSGKSAVFDGFISGSGGVRKSGTSTVTFNGGNSFTGDTQVQNGTLFINGAQLSSDVIVSPGATLSGIGTVKDLSIAGTFSPGNPLGRLSAQTVNFLPGSIMTERLVARPATGYFMPDGHSSFLGHAAVDVSGAELELTLAFPPSEGQTYVLGANRSDFPTTGTFLGKPEGMVLIRNQIPLVLSYVGGDGNDITLTVGGLPLRLGIARVDAGNGNGRIEPDECNDLHISIENPTGAAVTVAAAYLQSLNNRVVVTQAAADYDVVPASGSRTNRTAFQIRTVPNFPCGENVELHLVLETVGKGRFAIPVTLPTGTPGSFQEFESAAGPAIIPDAGALSSQLQVTTPFKVGKVRVALHATHPSAGQLRFTLISPQGMEVLLAEGEGGAGNNYGQSCDRRTVFTDSAFVSITTADAPFSGTFAPDGNLGDFVGLDSLGTWTLLAEDMVAGGLGALQCWTLELAPAECAPSGGGCVSCLATVHGTLNDDGPTMPEYLLGGYPSGCGDAPDCLGTGSTWNPPYRYGTHSFTNNGPDACVAVMLTSPCGEPGSGLFASAYLGDFNPGALCANLLGHSGHTVSEASGGFSFRVPAGERFTVVVNEHNTYDPFNGCDVYSLQLFGLPCPQERPTLHIAKDAGPDHVRLHWSTAYPGFELQGKPSLGGNGVLSVFTNIAVAPVVIDGHYSVTNQHDGKGNGFFRLRKP